MHFTAVFMYVFVFIFSGQFSTFEEQIVGLQKSNFNKRIPNYYYDE